MSVPKAQSIDVFTPDGSPIRCVCFPNPGIPVPGKPWHLVGCGRNFESPEAAQRWINDHWNDPSPTLDETTYATGYAYACGYHD